MQNNKNRINTFVIKINIELNQVLMKSVNLFAQKGHQIFSYFLKNKLQNLKVSTVAQTEKGNSINAVKIATSSSHNDYNRSWQSQQPHTTKPSDWSYKVSLIITSLISYKLTQQVHMIEDQQIRQLKKNLSSQISKLRNQYGQLSVYPEVKYQMRGNCYTIQFEIDQRKTDIFMLLTKCLTVYTNEKGFRVTDSKAFNNKDTGIVTYYIEFQQQDPKFKNVAPQKGRITITGVNSTERPSFRLIIEKHDTITPKNTTMIAQAYRQSVKPKEVYRQSTGPTVSSIHRGQPKQQAKSPQNQLYKKMEEFGVTVFDPKDKAHNLDWDYLAGYESQKRSIEDTVLLALNYPEIYDQITEATRVKFEQNRPKAVLFEGPPGTGKTTSAKIIAQQVDIPLVYMPIQAIMSKYYGQSEKKLAQFWEACKKLGKVIIFIDEIDAIAGSRDSDMHEASRRVLSTLLRKIDSFESTTDVLLICATNRKQDLDAAMLSRIDLSIKFSLPDKHSRAAIFSRYAKHLKEEDLSFLAEETEGFSGRNISDVCKHAQRKWASKLIRKEVEQKLPSLDQYISSLEERKMSELVI